MSARRRRACAGGFSLLEVMIALAILSAAIVVLLNIVNNNVRATNHAKLTTAATFLARAKISDIEDLVLEDGFVDSEQADAGDFSEQEFKHFRWETLIERVELPANMTEMAQTEASQASESDSPLVVMAGMMGGFMSALIEPIRVGLQESVRRLTVTVKWDELGRPEQKLVVVTYMTDPAKLDLAVQAGFGAPAGGAPGTGSGGAARGAGATPPAGGGGRP